jgi:hypothetical protein
MICYPLYQNGCGCYDGCGYGDGCGCGEGINGGGVGGGSATYPIGAAASAGTQCLNCGCPIIFGGLTYDYGSVVAHGNRSSDFVIKTAGEYRVCWNVTVQRADCGCGCEEEAPLGASYGFAINGRSECAAEGIEGTAGYDGIISKCCVLTLSAGEILRLIPTHGCDAVIVNATIDITKVEYQTPIPL